MGLIESWRENRQRFGESAGDFANNFASKNFIADRALAITCYVAEFHPENYANMSPLLRSFVDTSCRDKGEPGLPPFPERNFDGGQCVGVQYKITSTGLRYFNGENPQGLTYTVSPHGPLLDVFIGRDSPVSDSRILGLQAHAYDQNGNEKWFISPIGGVGVTYQEIDRVIERVDGLADDCGNLGDDLYPPSGDPPPEDIRIDIDYGEQGGDQFNLVLPFSPTEIIFEGDEYDVKVDVDGISLDPKIDVDINVGGDGTGDGTGGGGTGDGTGGGGDGEGEGDGEACVVAINNIFLPPFDEEEFEEEPSECTPPGDIELLANGEIPEGVEACEAEFTELEFLLITLTTLPDNGRNVLHQNPAHTDWFAGYLCWKIVEEGQSYYYPPIPVRKSRNAFRRPEGVNGYATYTTNGAKMHVSQVKRKLEDA